MNETGEMVMSVAVKLTNNLTKVMAKGALQVEGGASVFSVTMQCLRACHSSGPRHGKPRRLSASNDGRPLPFPPNEFMASKGVGPRFNKVPI